MAPAFLLSALVLLINLFATRLARVVDRARWIEQQFGTLPRALSVPELRFPVRRAKRAVVRGVDLRNEPVVVEGKDVLAQCLQHETDHLDGMLYLDRLAKDYRRAALGEARKKDWFWRR